MPDNSILSRLDGLKIKYEEIGQQMTDPEVIADVRKFIALNKEYKELEPIVHTSEKYRTALNNLNMSGGYGGYRPMQETNMCDFCLQLAICNCCLNSCCNAGC